MLINKIKKTSDTLAYNTEKKLDKHNKINKQYSWRKLFFLWTASHLKNIDMVIFSFVFHFRSDLVRFWWILGFSDNFLNSLWRSDLRTDVSSIVSPLQNTKYTLSKRFLCLLVRINSLSSKLSNSCSDFLMSWKW